MEGAGDAHEDGPEERFLEEVAPDEGEEPDDLNESVRSHVASNAALKRVACEAVVPQLQPHGADTCLEVVEPVD